MRIVILFVVLLSTGCLGNVWRVDSRFSPEEAEAIQKAADSWEAVGAEPLNLLFGQKVNGLDEGRSIVRAGERSAIALHEGFRNEDWNALHLVVPGREVIIMNVDRIDDGMFQRVAAHEMGHHYIGEDHLETRGALMYRSADAEGPTDADIAALRAQ